MEKSKKKEKRRSRDSPQAPAQPSVSPVFKRQLNEAGEPLRDAFAHPQVSAKLAEAIGLAVRLQQDDKTPGLAAKFVNAVESVIALVRELRPAILQLLDEKGLRNLLMGLLVEEGEGLPPLRFTGLPGYSGRPVWVLISDRDVAALARELKPGQIWVNATQLDHDSYFGLWGLVSYQIQRLGKEHRQRGRRPGATSRLRAAVATEIKANPGLTYAAIYSLALERGLWADDGSYYNHVDRNRKRILRLKGLADRM